MVLGSVVGLVTVTHAFQAVVVPNEPTEEPTPTGAFEAWATPTDRATRSFEPAPLIENVVQPRNEPKSTHTDNSTYTPPGTTHEP